MNRKRLGKGWIMALAMLLVWCGPVRAAEDLPAGEGTVSMQAAADQAGPVTLRIEGNSTQHKFLCCAMVKGKTRRGTSGGAVARWYVTWAG